MERPTSVQLLLFDPDSPDVTSPVESAQPSQVLADSIIGPLPSLISAASPEHRTRFVEFFTAQIRNKNTREAYCRAVTRFSDWCADKSVTLDKLQPILVAAYIEELGTRLSKPTVKQHLAALRTLFDWMVTGGLMTQNPAASVRGPKYSVKKGKTPVLDAAEARQLLDAIEVSTISGLRDRALLGLLVYSFARISAATGMNVEDYYQQGKRWWIRLHEKGGKYHEVPCHHNSEEYFDAYLAAAQISDNRRTPLFRTLTRRRTLSERRLGRTEAFLMIKRRARQAGLPENVCCHTFRATGITVFLGNGGRLEDAQRIAAHESSRTTKLYDRTGDTITLDEIERIAI